MWCLGRLLPLMIGEYVPIGDAKRNLFLLLLNIIDYVFAPKTTLEIISYVSVLINDHHTEFRRLYPECNITLKQHYMIHIPEWMERYVSCIIIKSKSWLICIDNLHCYNPYSAVKSLVHVTNRCGPMTRYWCMRYEAKHSFFKDLAHCVKCFKNITKTLTERHQNLVCYQETH